MSYVPPHLRTRPLQAHSRPSSTSTVTPIRPNLPVDSPSSRALKPDSNSRIKSRVPSHHAGNVLASPAADLKPMRARRPDDRSASASAGVDQLDMNLVESVSRSGGDGGEGDALKDWGLQERYRAYINERLDKHYTLYQRARDEVPPAAATEEVQSLGSIVLLFRKLREGVVASHRIDEFAIEVFGSSAKLALSAGNMPQLLSSLSGLVPGLYQAVDAARSAESSRSKSQERDLSAAFDDMTINQADDETDPTDDRAFFASLLLLYHMVQSDSRQSFQSLLLDLTRPASSRRSRRPFSPHDQQPMTTARPDSPPFVHRNRLSFAVRAARALAPETFNPLLYARLVTDPSASTYERHLLSLVQGRVHERTWTLLAKAYLSTDLQWAGRLLGVDDKEVEHLGWKKGITVDGGKLKLR